MQNIENSKIPSNEIQELETFILKLKGDYSFSRLGKPFITRNNYYYFDSGTGKVFEINKNLYRIFVHLWERNSFEKLDLLEMPDLVVLNELRSLKTAIESENILQLPPITSMQCNNGGDNNEDLENSQMKHISLEMTERCNLRCKYCIYQDGQGGFRTFGKKDISFDVIKKTVDLLSLSTEKEIYISFYGGEPLLKFDLIKQTIEYCKEKLKNKIVHYNMTTNATLITKEIATYLSSIENYFTSVSLDGPELIHNKNRVLADGSGSFMLVMNGLERLVKAEGINASKRINFNVVLEDRNQDNFNAIQDFFRTCELIPKDSVITTSYVSTQNKEFEYLGVGTEKENMVIKQIKHEIDPLSDWGIANLESNNADLDDITILSKDFIYKGLSVIHNRMLIDKPAQTHYMNGCCVQGKKILY